MLTALRGRPARPASSAWNLLKTLAGTAILWSLFFFALPFLLFHAESLLGMQHLRLDWPLWPIVGAVLFLLGSVLHLLSNFTLTAYGEGTPLFLDGPRRLVIAGPYRYVRNPIAMASLAQAAGVGLWLGSPLVLLYTLALALAEHFLFGPAEEADLEERFGDDYRRYRRRVRCWRPRLRGYDPAREAEEPPVAAERTNPPGRYVVLYDGHCKFCTAGVKRLLALARPGALEAVSFQDPGALDPFPGVTREACMREMYLVTPDGRVYGGFEAAVQAIRTRPVLGLLARLYYLPGVRLLCDLFYTLVAANRYRLLGKAAAAECEDGTCALHLAPGRHVGPHPADPGKRR
jgi:protein-S-isoprenylcysteine O-methyltransferase Ste14/predicted DCC family thiol-disulfide oxidoreductase YuxK